MDVTPLIPLGRQIIQSYGASGFKVSGERYEGSIIVTPEKTSAWHNKNIVTELELNNFSLFWDKDEKYDVFLFGTGSRTVFPDSKLLKELKEKGIKPDIMDTGAACRTYNVLMAEDRRVAALLMSLK